MLKIAFCDDDALFLKKSVPLIEQIFRSYKVDVLSSLFKNSNKLISAFKNCPSAFDVVFLDIDMPILDGKSTAKALRLLDKNFKLIFMTAYTQEAPYMFQYDAIGFLPKNELTKQLPDTIERVVQRIEEDRPKLQFFKIKDLIHRGNLTEIRLPLNSIMYIECIDRQIFLHTNRGQHELISTQFSQLLQEYLVLGFVNIHRTCIVNPKYIKEIHLDAKGGEVTLDDGTNLPVSRSKRELLKESFLLDIYHQLDKGEEIL